MSKGGNAKRIVVIGAGGHARVIADAILALAINGGPFELVGFVDDDPSLEGLTFLGRPLLGRIANLDRIDHDCTVIGIGDNDVRWQMYQALTRRGKELATVIHPRATIASDAKIGTGVVAFAGVIVNSGAAVGDDVILNTGCTVDHDCVVGAHSHICPGAHLGGTVVIGEGAYVGIGSTIIHNRIVGEWSTIGGGAAVVRDVAPLTTVVGVPARVLTK